MSILVMSLLPEGFCSSLVSLPGEPTPLGELEFGGTGCETFGTGFARFRQLEMYALVYLLEAQGRYRDREGVDRYIGTGDMLMLRPGVPHQYGPTEGGKWNEVYICFRGPIFAAWWKQAHSGPVLHLEPAAYWSRRFFELLEPGATASVVMARLHLLLANALVQRTDGDWLERAKLLLDAGGEVMALPGIAGSLGIGYESFRKQFQVSTGLSPGHWRRQARIRRAQDLITRAQLSNEQLAEQLGFADAFHFSKAFKQITGLTPTAFRKHTAVV